MTYLGKLFVAIDQLGNTLAGGNPDNTISARVGYFSIEGNSKYSWYWKSIQFIINTTFWPLDGKGHCIQAYYNDAGEEYKPTGLSLIHFVLNIIVFATSLVLMPLFYLGYLLGIVRPKKDQHLKKLKERLKASRRKLVGIESELKKDYVGDLEAVELSKTIIEKAIDVKTAIESGLK